MFTIVASPLQSCGVKTCCKFTLQIVADGITNMISTVPKSG